MKDGRSNPRRTNDSKLACLRRARGLTQGQLAEMVGCYAKDISRWEKGVVSPNARTLKDIADALKCSMDDLSEDPKKN